MNQDTSLVQELQWVKLNECFASAVDSSWWQEIPDGESLQKLVKFPVANRFVSQHLMEVFKIEALPSLKLEANSILMIAQACEKNWIAVAQRLGLMMISVPFGLEIDGKVKAKFANYCGEEYMDILALYSSHSDLQIFYKAVTFQKLHLLMEKPLDHLLHQFSFDAWSMLSLVLPKALTQRIHLTLPADWVADIQVSRKRFIAHKDLIQGLQQLLPWFAREIIK